MGDIVVMDEEGFITVVDRLKELIKYKVSNLMSLVLRRITMWVLTVMTFRASKFHQQNSKMCSFSIPTSPTLVLSACTQRRK